MKTTSLHHLVAALTLAAPAAHANPIVFISAFAAGEKAGIHAFEWASEKGELRPLTRTTGIQHPFFLALSPNRKFLYSIDAEKFGSKNQEHVAAFAVEGRTGNLRLLNRQSSHGSASCYVDVDPANKTVLVANYTTGNVASYPINADGSLNPAVTTVQHEGKGADPARQKGPNAHCFVTSPNGRFALAADLGIDKVLIYTLDSASGKIAPNPTQPHVELPPASGPRHLTFHPNGKTVYVINELANTVALFDWNAQAGSLKLRQTISTLPTDFSGKSYTADLKITPDGRFLYGTNRGHDSIASFRIAEDGTLTLIAITPSGGKGPQNLLITPDGRWLMCANMPGNNVIILAINPADGTLTPHGAPTEIPMPACIRLME
jgi:6-phosphogluconolactonase